METTNLNECYIYFALTGNGFDPDKISTALNLKATKIVREGSRIPGKIPVCSSWKYGTPLLRNGDVFRLGEIAEELIIPLLPLQEKITELIKILIDFEEILIRFQSIFFLKFHCDVDNVQTVQ